MISISRFEKFRSLTKLCHTWRLKSRSSAHLPYKFLLHHAFSWLYFIRGTTIEDKNKVFFVAIIIWEKEVHISAANTHKRTRNSPKNSKRNIQQWMPCKYCTFSSCTRCNFIFTFTIFRFVWIAACKTVLCCARVILCLRNSG